MALPAKTELFVRRQPGGVFTVVNESVTTGAIWFVDSTASTGADSVGAGRNPDKPLLTLDYAVGLCTASKGDKIYLLPGHAETVATAGGIALDVAGISVIGLGNGDNRPKFTFATLSAADLNVDKPNITVKNVVFVGNLDKLNRPIDINSSGCTFEDCEFRDDTAAKQTVSFISISGNSHRTKIKNCRSMASDTAGSVAFITIEGAASATKAKDIVIENCISHGDFAKANIVVSGIETDDLTIRGNHLENANAIDACFFGHKNTTGFISNNYFRVATSGTDLAVTCWAQMGLFENYSVNTQDLLHPRGYIFGTASVT